jgi:membrane-bound serine protease (ClpP class)
MTSLGLVLLVVGALVAVAEAHYPTHGITGGIGVLGGVVLAGAGAGVLALTVRRGLAARQRRVLTGAEGIIGHIGVVRSWCNGTGSVDLDGAVWQARRSDLEGEIPALHTGDKVVVERLSGLTLSVRPAEEWELL